jgi:folate-binding protein YgfZ
MSDRLTGAWERSGAVLSPETSRPLHYGDPEAELRAALTGCVLADGSNLARLRATGPDYLDLLHRLSTGDVVSLGAGEGRPTILTTPKGRIFERLFVHHLGDGGVLSIGGVGGGPRVLEHLARFTFAEKTGLADMTHDTFQFLIVGPQAERGLDASGLDRPESFHVRPGSLGGAEVSVLGQDGWSGDGYSVVGSIASAAEAWEALLPGVERAGGRPTGDEPLEARRVLCGLPASGHELTEEHNPLEAGQWEAVSFDKGCYVGQEVVARLHTYDKVTGTLVGLELPADAALPAVGTRLFDENRPVGDLTSAVFPPGRAAPVGLGYVKRDSLRPGLELRIGDAAEGVMARVALLPFPA